ncbi:MAG TPA: metallophosphoesterase [Thermoleophilaceae bacterium]|nr:metallophosphoesterase [Thermoleophilaceae bacterium]
MAKVDEKQIRKRLGEAYAEAQRRPAMTRRLGDEKIVVFSDQHKGARDGADDFQRCERSYNAALAYYHHMGWHLVLLGDVEELWENSFEEVAEKYPRALELEGRFHADGRYTRVFGNHDLVWSDAGRFQKAMKDSGVGDVTPVEAIRLTIQGAGENGEDRELFLTHGHQGTADSDSLAWLSKIGVRAWRVAQNFINRPINQPSMDWELRGEHSEAMMRWAEAEGRVLITGHTHKPVFWNGEKKPEAVPGDVTPPEGVEDPQEAEALRLAHVEWAEAEQERLKGDRPIQLPSPCYFNTGCCSFGDGDITGIEIDGGEIRLVRWPSHEKTRRQELEAMPLREVFAAVNPPG